MKWKTILLIMAAGFGGYVLGTKAGRGRYRELRSYAQKAANNPRLEKTLKKAEKRLSKLADKVVS